MLYGDEERFWCRAFSGKKRNFGGHGVCYRWQVDFFSPENSYVNQHSYASGLKKQTFFLIGLAFLILTLCFVAQRQRQKGNNEPQSTVPSWLPRFAAAISQLHRLKPCLLDAQKNFIAPIRLKERGLGHRQTVGSIPVAWACMLP